MEAGKDSKAFEARVAIEANTKREATFVKLLQLMVVYGSLKHSFYAWRASAAAKQLKPRGLAQLLRPGGPTLKAKKLLQFLGNFGADFITYCNLWQFMATLALLGNIVNIC